MIVVPVVSLLTKPPGQELLRKAFEGTELASGAVASDSCKLTVNG
jgi:hypothetical protein